MEEWSHRDAYMFALYEQLQRCHNLSALIDWAARVQDSLSQTPEPVARGVYEDEFVAITARIRELGGSWPPY